MVSILDSPMLIVIRSLLISFNRLPHTYRHAEKCRKQRQQSEVISVEGTVLIFIDDLCRLATPQ